VSTCPNCGTVNDSGDRFCQECGADLSAIRTTVESADPGSNYPQPFPAANQPQMHWQGTTGGFAPPQKQRKTWLWIIIGLLAGCVVCCCIGVVLGNTSLGGNYFGDSMTRISDWLTQVAPSPTPTR
jgi:hypothetical protein